MSEGHSSGSGGKIKHGDAAVLFPVKSLSTDVFLYRDAELRLDAADSESVLVVTPTGFASGYALTNRPLTAIEVDGLSREIREEIEDRADIDLTEFELIKIGRLGPGADDHSLSEF